LSSSFPPPKELKTWQRAKPIDPCPGILNSQVGKYGNNTKN